MATLYSEGVSELPFSAMYLIEKSLVIKPLCMAKVEMHIPARATHAYLAPMIRSRSREYRTPKMIVMAPVKAEAKVRTTPKDPIMRFISNPTS